MRTPTIEVYRDETAVRSQQWRWRLLHGNGKILAASSEGFSSRAGAKGNFRRTLAAMTAVTEEQLEQAGH